MNFLTIFQSNNRILKMVVKVAVTVADLFFYCFSKNRTDLIDHPLRSSLKAKESSKVMPELCSRMKIVSSDHSYFNNTFWHECIELYKERHPNLDQLKKLDDDRIQSINITLDGCGLEKNEADGPNGAQRKSISKYLNELLDGITVEYKGQKKLEMSFQSDTKWIHHRHSIDHKIPNSTYFRFG